jgi:hypothetical protein
MSTYAEPYYDDDEDYSYNDMMDMNDMVKEFDIDDMLAEEGIELDFKGSNIAVNPIDREFKVGEDLAAKLINESSSVMLEDVSEMIDLDDSIQEQIASIISFEGFAKTDEAIDILHSCISKLIGRKSFDAAMYDSGGFLPDTENDWVDMVQQVKENQAIETAKVVAGVLNNDIQRVDSLMTDFGSTSSKVAWCYGAQIRAVMDYMTYRSVNDQDQLDESYKILSMLGDLNAQIITNEVMLFEERAPLSLVMKKDDEKAIDDAYKVLEDHTELVKILDSLS